jgi:hypothetical protein
MARHIRHIIKPPGAYKEFRALARRNGWQIIDKIEKEPRSPVALQEIFTDPDETVGIHYVEDGLAELPYIQVSGPRLDHFSRLIAESLPVYSEDEIFSTWDTASAMDDKIDAILRVGVVSEPEPSEPYLSRIRQAIEDPAPEVRAAGLVAFSYHPWDALKPLVEKIRDADPDDDARERARVILDIWTRTAQSGA